MIYAKILLSATLISLLTACDTYHCNFEKGYCKNSALESLKNKNREQDAAQIALESDINLLQQIINSLTATIQVLETAIAQNSLNIQIALSSIQDLEQEIYDAQVDITELQTRTTVTELIDPCGPTASFDEVLIRLSSGDIIAYFQTGSKRFLTVLSNGSYTTTDAQQCNFTVLNGSVQW